jgi:hypothetical protein
MAWGDDERVRQQLGYQQGRFQQQKGPVANAIAYNYGRATEANYGDYTDVMNRYRQLYGAAAEGYGGGGGGGGGDYGAGGGVVTRTPFLMNYNDPFNSYAGYQEFSKTGGYSPADIANMRARGVSPVRASYANAQRELSRQRALQGGYAPNAIATLAKMSRERGQSMADAIQNVEAGLAEARNKGRLSGLGGMFGVEKERLAADLKIQEFNALMQERTAAANAAAAAAGAARSSSARAAADAASRSDQFKALGGMTQMYGTTPGLSNMFGNQLLQATGMGGQYGMGYVNAQQAAAQIPGNYERTMGAIGQVSGMAAPWVDYFGGGNEYGY